MRCGGAAEPARQRLYLCAVYHAALCVPTLLGTSYYREWMDRNEQSVS